MEVFNWPSASTEVNYGSSKRRNKNHSTSVLLTESIVWELIATSIWTIALDQRKHKILLTVTYVSIKTKIINHPLVSWKTQAINSKCYLAILLSPQSSFQYFFLSLIDTFFHCVAIRMAFYIFLLSFLYILVL